MSAMESLMTSIGVTGAGFPPRPLIAAYQRRDFFDLCDFLCDFFDFLDFFDLRSFQAISICGKPEIIERSLGCFSRVNSLAFYVDWAGSRFQRLAALSVKKRR